MEEPYDIVIVGCGMAGAVAGLTALQEDLNVCIVERKQRESIGKKICGELMPQKTCEWLKDEFNIAVNSYPLKGLAICTLREHITHRRSASHRLCIEEPLCTIDRWQFGQTLVTELVKRGAHIEQGTVKGSVIKNGVKGVKTKDSRTFLGTVTIDCSGISSVLTKEVSFTDFTSHHTTWGMAYKENLTVEEPLDLEYAVLLFDKDVVPSGYMWCFPKGEHELNAGIGGLMRNGDALKASFHKIIGAHKAFTIQKRTHTGVGILPLGQPLPSIVGPGLLVCGDAACQVNPLTGEGIAPAIMAGHRAAKTATQAVRNNDTSVKGLWQYNYECLREHGAMCGPLCVLRDFLLSLSGEELTFLLEKMVTGEDIARLEQDWSSHTWGRKLTILLNSWKKPQLLYKSYIMLKKMMEVKRLYECYPAEPELFPLWQKSLNLCLREVHLHT